MSTWTKTLLGFAIATTIIIAITLIAVSSPGRGGGGSEADLSPTVSISPQPDPSADSPEPGATATQAADEKAAADVAAHFTEALYSQSYQDATPNTWITAIQEHSTERLYEELTAGADPDDAGSMWPEYISERMTDSVIVKSAQTQVEDEYTVVLVQYALRTTTRSGTYSSDEAHTLRVVEQDGRWLVDRLNEDPDDLAGFFDHGDHAED